MLVSETERIDCSDISAALEGLQEFVGLRAITSRQTRRAPKIENLRLFEDVAWNDGVIGYGVSQKRIDSEPTEQICVRFYVRRKIAKSRLKASTRIPSAIQIGLPDDRQVTLPTDVVEHRQIPVAQSNVSAGDSIGAFGEAGTLGLAVLDQLGRKYALTCSHVTAPWWMQPHNAPVRSPAQIDSNSVQQVIGTVADWTVLDPGGINTVDASLVLVNPDVNLSNANLHLGATPSFFDFGISEYVNLRFQPISIMSKRGLIKGVIDSVENGLPINFGGREFGFFNIVSYQAPVLPGDSGSAVLDSQGRVLGLHFAGIAGAGLGYCVITGKILQAFQSYGLTIMP
jgi:hypothetical protein